MEFCHLAHLLPFPSTPGKYLNYGGGGDLTTELYLEVKLTENAP